MTVTPYMTLRVTAFELQMLLRTRLTGLTLLLFAVAVSLMLLSSWAGNSRADADKSAVASRERQRWLDQGDRDAHSAAHYSVYVFKQSRPMQALDPGIEPFVGQAVWLEPHWQNEMVFRPLQEVEPFQRMGFADPAGFLIELAPLLIFFIAFTAIAADRERGTLRLILGAALDPGAYLRGKWLAVTVFAALALIVPVLLAGAVALPMAGSVDDAMRFALWLLGMVIYIGALAAIGVAVCANAASARLGFMILLGLWLTLAFAAPRAASTLAERLTVVPAYQSVQLQLQREAPVYWSAEQEQQQIEQLLRRYGVERVADLPVDLRGALLDFNERESHEVFDRVLGGFHDAIVRQDRTFAWQGWLSPAIGMQALSTALAGSNFAHHLDFITFAEHYRRDLVNRMNAEMLAHSRADSAGRYTTNVALASRALYEQIEPFDYRAPGVAFGWNSAGGAPWFLLGWLVAGGVALAVTQRSLRL